MRDKKFAIINSNNTEIISAIKNYFAEHCDIVEKSENLDNYDLVILTDSDTDFVYPFGCTVINIHNALLPSFQCKEPIKEAFTAGVKVSGVTIHRVEKDNFWGQILAQYPVLIGLDTHIDEFEKDIIDIAKKLVIPVIDAILNDRVFDFQDLFRGGCQHSGGCGGICSGCSH